MNLPEGLYLGMPPADDTLAVFDAQDIMWIDFYDGGNGDPYEWPKNIVRATCAALGVRTAIDEWGNECTVDELLEKFYGTLDFLT